MLTTCSVDSASDSSTKNGGEQQLVSCRKVSMRKASHFTANGGYDSSCGDAASTGHASSNEENKLPSPTSSPYHSLSRQKEEESGESSDESRHREEILDSYTKIWEKFPAMPQGMASRISKSPNLLPSAMPSSLCKSQHHTQYPHLLCYRSLSSPGTPANPVSWRNGTLTSGTSYPTDAF